MFCCVFLSSSAHPSSRALSRFNLLCFARRRFRSVSDWIKEREKNKSWNVEMCYLCVSGDSNSPCVVAVNASAFSSLTVTPQVLHTLSACVFEVVIQNISRKFTLTRETWRQWSRILVERPAERGYDHGYTKYRRDRTSISEKISLLL